MFFPIIAAPTGATGPAGPQGEPGPAGATATNENAMLYNTASQTVAAADTLSFAANQVNSEGSITAEGTTGLILEPGQYLVNFKSDAVNTAAGRLGAALALDGTQLDYANTVIASPAAETQGLALTAVVDIAAASLLTVINSGAGETGYENSTLTVVKLA